MIRFGVCTKFDKLELLEKAGYDYMEFALSSLEKKSEEEFAEICQQVDAASLQVEAFNGFFPADIALVGPASPPTPKRRCAGHPVWVARWPFLVVESPGTSRRIFPMRPPISSSVISLIFAPISLPSMA